MIIDFHAHCFPDELAVKATAALAEKAGIPFRLHGTVSELKTSMEEAGIQRSVVLSTATKPSQTERITEWAVSIQDDRISAFGSIHPEYGDWANELSRMKDLGLKGIKLHPEYQDFFVDEERMFPIYERAFELGLIIMFHAGADIGLPPPYHCTPQKLRKVVKLFHGGKIVAAHMGGYKYWDDVEKYLAGEELYLDTSFSLDRMNREQFMRILHSHGYKKLLFATDSPWSGQAEEVNKLKSLGLAEDVEIAVLGGNAKELLQL